MKKLFGVLLLTLTLATLLTSCGLTVPRPEIKSGEFDFSVTYEYNGVTKTVKGVYVCEYNGTEWALDGGYHRTWTGYVKGGKIEDHVEIDTVDGDEIVLVLNLIPDYFMDDFNEDLYDVPVPYIMVKDYGDDGEVGFLHDADVIAETYGVRIISYKYEKPVKNSFGLFK